MSANSKKQLFELQKSHADNIYESNQTSDVAKLYDDSSLRWSKSISVRDLLPAFATEQPQSILTIGDGSAHEAVLLKSQGHTVTASDISVGRLEKIKDSGYIDDCLELDAESLSLQDNSYDFVFAKETLHHLQRPYLGLYECLRVCRKAICIIEPATHYPSTIPTCLRQIFRRIARRPGSQTNPLLPKARYEDCGNYLYMFNPFELTQSALAMGMNFVAYRYSHEVMRCPDGLQGDALEKWKKHKSRKHAFMDKLVGDAGRKLLTFMIFKSGIDQSQRKRLEAAGFQVPTLKKNHVLAKAA
jgi:ubiquinone/menaquinone biosynthesis C-methylase UbiE